MSVRPGPRWVFPALMLFAVIGYLRISRCQLDECDSPPSPTAVSSTFAYLKPIAQQTAVPPLLEDNPLFITGAFVDPVQRLLRIIAIGPCKLKTTLKIQLDGSGQTYPVTHKSISNCPWSFSPKCDWVGKYLDAKLDASAIKALTIGTQFTAPIHVHLKRQVKDSWSTVSVPLPHSTGNVKPHKLAICVQPAYFYSEWIQLAQFVHLWKELGASKILFYAQSINNEAMQLLKMYTAEGLLEIVPWPTLPPVNGTDVNEHVYRTEVVTAVNHCLMTSRSIADYVAFVDLDEIIYVNSSSLRVDKFLTTLPTKLRSQLTTKQVGCYLFRSSNTHYELTDLLEQANVRTDAINFEYLNSVDVEKYIYPAGQRSKLICRPDTVNALHVHQVLSYNPGYAQYVVDPVKSRVLHLRRVRSYVAEEHNQTTPTNLSGLVSAAQQSYTAIRQKHSGLLPSSMANYGVQALAYLEDCYSTLHLDNKQSCPAIIKCEANMTMSFPDKWNMFDKSWTYV